MREVNLGALDLNLLVPLKALLEERHVTQAAEKVGLSQPAMSRALQRLRIMFADPLLVRGRGGRMTRTARGNELLKPLLDILTDVSHMVASPSMDPSEMRGEVVIASRDYEMAALMPSMIARVSKQAPGLTLSLRPMVGDDLSPLEENRVDFVVAGTDRRLATLNRQTLLRETFVCVLAADHEWAQQPLTLDNYLAMKHCVVSFAEQHTPGFVDRTLAERGQKRNIRVRVPYFLAAAQIVANSDLVVTLPRQLGLHLEQQQSNLKTLALPLEVPPFSIFLYWHIRNQLNPIHGWLREMFLA
jgi:DNA-binding transcriptional LysR family regulator